MAVPVLAETPTASSLISLATPLRYLPSSLLKGRESEPSPARTWTQPCGPEPQLCHIHFVNERGIANLPTMPSCVPQASAAAAFPSCMGRGPAGYLPAPFPPPCPPPLSPPPFPSAAHILEECHLPDFRRKQLALQPSFRIAASGASPRDLCGLATWPVAAGRGFLGKCPSPTQREHRMTPHVCLGWEHFNCGSEKEQLVPPLYVSWQQRMYRRLAIVVLAKHSQKKKKKKKCSLVSL